MAVDWALHNKPGNPHVHVMCTVRGFNRDRSWARMEKKVIALDADGNRTVYDSVAAAADEAA